MVEELLEYEGQVLTELYCDEMFHNYTNLLLIYEERGIYWFLESIMYFQ